MFQIHTHTQSTKYTCCGGDGGAVKTVCVCAHIQQQTTKNIQRKKKNFEIHVVGIVYPHSGTFWRQWNVKE